ncbi:MAG: DNA methylase, partial [Lachnospiraceae bacterium]|nr:DNA methylase [Lachnospiraceae bacterium]
KKAPADKDGVRIAELNEETYRYLLWDHKPLTNFWQIGPGKARRLASSMLLTMGDVAEKTQYNEEYFYKTFGIDGEILIDHAWGIEPVTMADIKNYRSDSHSLSNGQVLPRPYKYEEALLVFKEMIDGLCTDMVIKSLTAEAFSWWVSYDYKSLEAVPDYNGPLSIDFYGRVHPKHSGGGVKLLTLTNSVRLVTEAMVPSFNSGTDHRLLFRRLGVCANNIVSDEGMYQLDLFTDYDALDRERRIQNAMLKVRRRYGTNAIFKGSSLIEASTTLERNLQVGGHRA